jgi:hypothetical protein
MPACILAAHAGPSGAKLGGVTKATWVMTSQTRMTPRPVADSAAAADQPKARERDRAIGQANSSLRADVPAAGLSDSGPTDPHHNNGSP